jgi:L-ascorbate metabolism protein UlaG (beta-lactamase superfamily)
MLIQFIGHSTFKLTLPGGAVLMTDPWLGRSLLKRYRTPIEAATVERCDALLVSHAHIDHFDREALRMAKRLGSVVAGSETAVRMARAAGIKDTLAMKPGDSTDIGGARIHAVHASHPLGPGAVGFIIESEKTIYFSGDTVYNTELVKNLNNYKIDIALLQIACTSILFLKDGLDIADAARLARRIKPSIVIPMHYHNLMRRPDPALLSARLSGTGIKVDIMQPGDERRF